MRNALFSLSALALIACQPPPAPPVPGAIDTTGEVVGTANGRPITQDMVDAVSNRFPPGQLEQLKAQGQYQQFLDQMALGQVLYERAIEAKLTDDPEVKLLLAMSARDALAAEMVQRVGKNAVTDEAVKQAYEDHAVQYRRPTVHARHLVVADLTEAESLKDKLAKGADFTALVAEFTLDPSTKDSGGDLGWFEKERMFPAIAEAAFSAEKGTIAGPIETRMGWHLILVEDKRDSTPLEEVREELEQMVKQAAVETYIKTLQEETDISWVDSAEPAPEADGHDHGPGEAH